MARRKAYNPVGRTEVARLKRELNALFLRVEQSNPASELTGDLNRYLCVRVCGYLELSVVSLARAACENLSGGVARRFSLSWLERSPNPRADQIVTLVDRFSNDWRGDLETLLASEERGSRLNALVGLRNDVAHGKNQGVSAKQAHDYYDLVNEVVDWLMERLDPLVAPGS